MSEVLRQGSRGDEVRRLQHNLNVAVGARYGLLQEDGIFGPRTALAVEHFQRDFRLTQVDRIVGPATRRALATRVVLVSGSVSRIADGGPARVAVDPVRSPPMISSPGGPVAPSTGQSAGTSWVFQAQPVSNLTPPPFLFRDPSGGLPPGTVVNGGVTFALVYRTATEGPHWEFGFGPQFTFNSRSSATDPRYTLQLQGNVSYADPSARGRFHTSLLAQVAVLQNVDPGTTALGAGLGGQVSVDIIKDRWNVFTQGGVAAQWTLANEQRGQPAGQLLLGSQFTLGTTIQWDVRF